MHDMPKNPLTYHDGAWHDGNPPMLGPMDHAWWMGSSVFDGARAFSGLAPDIDLHCARLVRSAEAFGMEPEIAGPGIEALCWEGIEKFAPDAALYIRPMFYFTDGFVVPDYSAARFILTMFESPMTPWHGVSACLVPYRRPGPDMAPTNAKAACLYPNVIRAMTAARKRGYETAMVLDPNGNVAEFATNNLFMVKNGVVKTPAENGCFLAGITRWRVMELLKSAGVTVEEATLTVDDVMDADEVFMTGNYSKVLPATKIEDKVFPEGPIADLARKLYFEFAERSGRRRAA